MSETKIDTSEIDAEIHEVRARLRVLENQRKAMLIAQHNIAEGDIVRSTSRFHAGKVGRVVSIEPFSSRAWVTVHLQKQDGSFGTRIARFMGDWEKVPTTPEPSP